MLLALFALSACTSGGDSGKDSSTGTTYSGTTADSGTVDTADSGATDTMDSTGDSTGDSTIDSGPDSGDTGGATTTVGCPAVSEDTHTFVVTDIDETLTTDDNEFLTQIVDPSHDPEMRPDANTLMQDYAALGYRIIYLTARGDDLFLLDGTTATDATLNWLYDHDFPVFDDGDVFLADGLGEFGSGASDYKAEVLATLQTGSADFEYAYGNADTDITAYQDVALDNDHIFLVGDLSTDASSYGVQPISNDDAYTQHIRDWIDAGKVPCGG